MIGELRRTTLSHKEKQRERGLNWTVGGNKIGDGLRTVAGMKKIGVVGWRSLLDDISGCLFLRGINTCSPNAFSLCIQPDSPEKCLCLCMLLFTDAQSYIPVVIFLTQTSIMHHTDLRFSLVKIRQMESIYIIQGRNLNSCIFSRVKQHIKQRRFLRCRISVLFN